MKNQTNLLIILFFFTAFISVAQNRERQRLWHDGWEANFSIGPTLFWGDMSDDVSFPAAKFIKKDEGKFAASAQLNKYVGPLGLQLQLVGGFYGGARTKWNPPTNNPLLFQGSFLQYDAQLAFDPIKLFGGYKPDRRFSFEGHGGIGMIHFNSTKTQTITNTKTNVKDKATVIPFGATLKYRITGNLILTGSNFWAYAYDSDLLDAHKGSGSNINDIYSFTSLGITYLFSMPERAPREPRIIKEPDKIPDPVIAVTPRKDDAGELTTKVIISLPSEVVLGEEFTIDVRIETKNLPASARLQQTFPFGFSVNPPEQSDGEYRFRDMIMSMNWNPYPQSNILQFSYKAKALDLKAGDYNIPGLLLYQEDNIDKVYQFKNSITIKAPPVIAVTEKTDTPVIKTDVTPVTKVDETPVIKTDVTPVKKPVVPATVAVSPAVPVAMSGLEYRVQVRAIYGGKESANRIQRELKLAGPVFEDLHKGFYKYSTGQFTTYAEANALKNSLREQNLVPDAFVVAYYNGVRLNSLAEVPDIQQKQTPSTTPAQGVSYKIQIAAISSGSSLSAGHFANQYGLSDPISVETHNGLKKFTLGQFTDSALAQEYLQQIRQKVPDAFIVKYINGSRQ